MKVNSYTVSTVEEISQKLAEITGTLPNSNCTALDTPSESDTKNSITVLVTFTLHKNANLEAYLSSGRMGFDWHNEPTSGSFEGKEITIECSGALTGNFDRPLQEDAPLQKYSWSTNGDKRNVLAYASLSAELPQGASDMLIIEIAEIFKDRINRMPSPPPQPESVDPTRCVIS